VARVFSDVHRLALTYRLTSYDAAYLELALRRNLPLATLDAELVAACQSR
jgi:predicted nucleic acid-binding protein